MVVELAPNTSESRAGDEVGHEAGLTCESAGDDLPL